MVAHLENPATIPNQDLLSFLLSNAPKQPEQPLFIDAHDDGRSLSWQETHSLIRQVVGGLVKKGVKPGDRIAIHCRNDLHYIPVVVGIIGAGAIAVPVVSGHGIKDAAETLKVSSASWVFADPEKTADKAAALAGIDQSRVIHFDPKDHSAGEFGMPFSSIVEGVERDHVQVDPQSTAMLFSTSGTTGKPKLSMISHANLIAQQIAVETITRDEKPYKVKWLWQHSLHHARSFIWGLATFRTGHPMYIVTDKHPGRISTAIKKHSITDVLLAPDDIESVHGHLGSSGHEHVSTLRHIYSSSGPVKDIHYQNFSGLLGKDTIISRAMGITECSGMVFALAWPGTHGADHADSGWVGHLLLPNTYVKFIDKEGNDAGNGPGELCLKGPSVFQGYYNDKDATERAFTPDGFYRTSDIMEYDISSKEFRHIDRLG